MKLGKRILLGAACVLLLLISWIAAIATKSDNQRQEELLAQADIYLADQVYVQAEPLLDEAVALRGKHQDECEARLKQLYLAMVDQTGYRRKYTDLLDAQMDRDNAPAEVFLEAAHYYLDIGKVGNALTVLKSGIQKTDSEELKALYEQERYAYSYGRDTYEDVTTAANGAIQVKREGLWGLAKADGTLLIPCMYDKVSTYSNGRVLVKKGNEISFVNLDNNRLVLCHDDISDFTNWSENRAALRMADGWHMADAELRTSSTAYEALGMFSGGYAAAAQNGRWGVVDPTGEWLVSPEYDGIITDSLGRCYNQGAVFAQKGGQAVLLVDGQQVAAFEDAHPFGSEGYAAVKKNGLWGFVDTTGQVQIDFQYEDAHSFGQHLAAVSVDGAWGYISLSGKIVIEPFYLEAGSFASGAAPVHTVDGWSFLILTEFEEATSL